MFEFLKIIFTKVCINRSEFKNLKVANGGEIKTANLTDEQLQITESQANNFNER